MSKLEIRGIVPIVPTPFVKDGGVHWGDLEKLLNFAVQAAVCAVCLPAYASEFYKLTEQERRELVLRAIAVHGRTAPRDRAGESCFGAVCSGDGERV